MSNNAPYNSAEMHVLEAKDFLVKQTAEQAALENVPLSDLEKRMMYFTESAECPEDPIALNDAFEAEYDTAAYEKKISALMARAYRRIKKESPERLRLWNNAFRALSRGDHYILLFLPQERFGRPARTWKQYALAGLAIVGFFSLMHFFFGSRHGRMLGERAPVEKYIPSLSPTVQHALQILFLLVLIFTIFPKLLSGLAGLLPRLRRER